MRHVTSPRPPVVGAWLSLAAEDRSPHPWRSGHDLSVHLRLSLDNRRYVVQNRLRSFDTLTMINETSRVFAIRDVRLPDAA